MCLAVGRQTPANEVDHVIPHGGDEDLFWNGEKQALCKSCHSEKTWYETTKSRKLPSNIRPKSNDITLLFGAPCSGRRAWAKAQKCKVIDFEQIKRTVSGYDWDMPSHYIPTCISLRNRLIKTTTEKFILIGSLSNPKQRQDWINKLKAKPYMMMTSQDECIKRLKSSGRPNIKGQIALIKRWFAEFVPLGNEVFIS